MPPWLKRICEARGLDFIDVCTSPLRFGRDLYVALRTSSSVLYERIAAQAVAEEEIRLEASYLAAEVRFQQEYLIEMGRYQFDLKDSLLFIRQAPYDASLLSADNRSLRFTDFADRLRQIVG
jgi:hypothetical protein